MNEQPGDIGPLEEQAPQGDQSELDLGVIATGDPVVDAALKPLEQLGDRSVSEHPQVFEEVHRRIDAAMTRAGDAPEVRDAGSESLRSAAEKSSDEFPVRPEGLEAD